MSFECIKAINYLVNTTYFRRFLLTPYLIYLNYYLLFTIYYTHHILPLAQHNQA